MLELLGSVFSGGLTGIIGTGISSFVEYKNKKLSLDHELKKMDHDRNMMKLEFEGRIKVSETEAALEMDKIETKGEIELEKIDAKAFTSSIEAESKGAVYATGKNAKNSWVFIFVDAIRGLIRPVLTIYLVIVVSWMYGDIQSVLAAADEELSSEQAMLLLRKITDTILYITSAVILWWFGSRTKKS